MQKFLSTRAIKASIFLLPVILVLFLLSLHSSSAATSSDAIAVRVLPNNKHYSATRWYKEQNFKGSPQSIFVDGYEAVRDGRTVYVAATNIVDTDNNNVLSKSDVLYTNIYIISYSQEAENSTLDILGQLLTHWKFNINLTKPGNCKQETQTVCSNSGECATNDYCQGSKAVIIRDVKRLADLSDLNTILANYKNSHNGLCPKLLSGTYLPGKSISTWPSWQANLSAELGAALPIDPINKLGQCSEDPIENKKYNQTTCWNETEKKFSVVSYPVFNLPKSSFAYLYLTEEDGKNCSFFMPTESGLVCNSVGACTINNNISEASNFSVATSTITLKGYCGDGFTQLDLSEQCDDDNSNNNDACTNNCKWSIKTLPQINFSGNGSTDALVYDNNNLPTSINNTNGLYLKLDKMLDTPYAWFADTNNNLISEVRTYVKCYPYGGEVHADDKWNIDPSSNGKTGYICPKKLPDGWDYSGESHQHPGQIIKEFSIVGYPSRTAVNVETNEVWIAARSGAGFVGSGHVEKLQMDASGDYSSVAAIPSTQFLGLLRGLTIQRNGDIWTADCTSNLNTASIKRFSGSTLELNKTIGADGSFVCPYGLAIDSADNIWMNDNGGGGMKKINPDTGQIFTYANAGIYGITVDTNDNAWGGGYINYGIKKIPYGQNSGEPIHFTGFTDWQTYMTGVTLDKDGYIWSGGYTPYNETYKFNQSGALQVGFPVPSGGVNPHGIFGTSDGYVWQSHISSNIIRVFNSNGSVVADFKGGSIANGIYTYSDATGLNRAMVMRSGIWVSGPVDSGTNNQHWGIISWQQNIKSTKQSLEVYARADDDADNLKNKTWIRVYLSSDTDNQGETWNALGVSDSRKIGRYLQFKVLLRSAERGVTPVIWDFQVK